MPSTARRVGSLTPLIALAVLVVGHVALILSRSYRPGGDWAFIDLRTSDVFSTDTPLTGAWSRYGWNHPGPFLYDALAIPRLLAGGSWRGLWLGAMVLNLVAIGASWWVAARRSAGWAAVLVTAAVWTIAAATPHLVTDPWNASVVVLALVPVAAGTVAVRDGDRRGVAVVLVVFVAVAQTHVAYAVLLAPCMAAVLVVGCRRWLRWTASWLGIGALLCLPILFDTLANWPGNLWRSVRFTATSDEPTVGLGQVARVLGRAGSLSFFTEPGMPSFAAVVGDTPWGTLPFVAPVLAIGAWWLARRKGWTTWRLALETVGLLWLGGALMTWRTRGPLLVWLTTWTVVVAALTWCLVLAVAIRWIAERRTQSPAAAVRGEDTTSAWAASTEAEPVGSVPVDLVVSRAVEPVALERAARSNTEERVAATAMVAVASVASVAFAVVNVVGSVGVGYPFQEFTPVVEQFAEAALDQVDEPTLVDLAGPEYEAGAVQSALIAQLEDEGGRPRGRPDQGLQLGGHRVSATLDGRRLLVQVEPRSAAPDGADVLSVSDPLSATDRAEADRLIDELTALLVAEGLDDRVALLANEQAPLAAFDGPTAVTDRRADFERLGALHAQGPRIVLYLIDPTSPGGS